MNWWWWPAYCLRWWLVNLWRRLENLWWWLIDLWWGEESLAIGVEHISLFYADIMLYGGNDDILLITF